jgi:hypothetical protein
VVGVVSPISLRTAPTSGPWAELLARAGGKTSIKGLPRLARFAAARGELPEDVVARTLADFEVFLLRRSLEPHPRLAALRLASLWERLRLSLPFWPQQQLALPKRIAGRPALDGADHAAGIKLGSIRLSDADAPCPRTPPPVPVLTPEETKPATLADCLACCADSEGVPAARLKRFQAAVSVLERLLDRPATSIPAAPPELRPLLAGIMPAGHGISEARWRNIRGDLKGLLITAGWVSPLSHRTAALGGPWAALLLTVAQHGPVRTLPPFARWCAAEGLLPEAVTVATMEAYKRFLEELTLDPTPRHSVQQLVRAWNALARRGAPWPGTLLQMTSRAVRKAARPESLPTAFIADLDAYLAALREPDPLHPLARRAAAANSIKLIRGVLLRGAALLIEAGVRPDELTRLGDLASPGADVHRPCRPAPRGRRRLDAECAACRRRPRRDGSPLGPAARGRASGAGPAAEHGAAQLRGPFAPRPGPAGPVWR